MSYLTSTKALLAATCMLYTFTHAPLGLSLPVGNDFVRLTPTSSGTDFISIESSLPTQAGTAVIGSSVVHSFGVLPVIEEAGIEVESSMDTLTSAHQHLSIGLTEDFEFHAQLPLVVHTASLEHPSDKGAIADLGLVYAGLGAKYRFHKKAGYEFAVATELGADLMEKNPYVGDTTSFASSVYLTSTAQYHPVVLGVNLGYKYRNTGEAINVANTNRSPILPISHIFVFGTALAFQTDHYGSLIGEVYGSHALRDDSTDRSDRSATSVEALIGYSKIFANGVGIKAACGTEILRGIGTSKIRVLAGMDFQFDFQGATTSTSTQTPSKRQQQTPTQQNSNDDNNEDEDELYLDDEVEYPSFEDATEDYSL